MSAGLQSAVAGETLPSLEAVWPPVRAGVLWVPITFAATLLARRVPWDPAGVRTFMAVHAAAALATSFVLNAGFFGLEALRDAVPPGEAPGAALRSAIRWLHLNAAGYAAVVLAVHVLDGRLSLAGPPPSSGPAPSPMLRVPHRGGEVRVPLREIDWIEADGDYARVHVGSRSYLVSRRMKGLAREFAGTTLVRVHRSAIVNTERVRELRHRSHGDYEAVLADGTVVRVSRSRRDGLFRVLER